jgi:hypothetical protein
MIVVAILALYLTRAGSESADPDGRSAAPLSDRAGALAVGQPSYAIPTGAHSTGALGTNWRTDLEVHNPGTTQASYTIALLKRDTDNSSPVSQSFSLAPGRAARYTDVIDSVFHFTGAAAFRITPTSGSVLVTSRTYNALGGGNPLYLPAGATFGQFVPGFTADQAIATGQEGRLIQLAHRDPNSKLDYRTNIGYVNTGAATIALVTDLYRADGVKLGTFNDSLRPYEYKQIDNIFERVTSSIVADGYAILHSTTPGATFLAYASVIDNRTGDPVCVPAQRLTTSTTSPTPTPTTPAPTATPTQPPSASADLRLYTPSGWPACVVAHYQSTWDPSVTPFLSTYYDANIFIALANFGATTFTGPVELAVYIDGASRGTWSWANTSGLETNYYVKLTITDTNHDIAAGPHSVRVVVDPNHKINLANRPAGDCSANWTWTSIVFAPQSAPKTTARQAPGTITDFGTFPLDGRAPVASAASLGVTQTLYIPTGAHSTGALGTNWRTDLEVHNPGTTQASYTIALLKRDTDNSSPVSQSFSLAPGRAARYTDVIDSVFHFTGAAAFRITPTSGSVLVTSRTYNALGGGNPLYLPAGATFGQFVPGFTADQAIATGQEGRLIQLAHRDPNSKLDYRTNIGYVNTGAATIALVTDLYRADGVKLGTFNDSLRPYEYKQIDNIFERVTSSIVADGYAILHSTTPGATFLAYASVIDNRTGDPVCVPAQRLTTSTTSPTPTPTTPPQAGTQPLGTIETINDIMTVLGTAGTGNKPTVEQIITTLQTSGIDAIITDAVSRYPTLVTRVPGGGKVDFGTGYTLDDGSVLTGSITVTTSNLSVTSSRAAGNYALTFNNFTKNGGYPTVQTVTGGFDASVSATKKVVGDATINGSGTTAVGTTTITGSVHVDTNVCPKYPVGGTVTVRRGSDTRTVTFTPACDGTYVYTGSGYSPYLFEGMLLKCDGTPQDYSQKISLAAEGDHLAVNPTCPGTGGLQHHRVTGTKTATSVRFFFRSTYPGDRTHVYEGIFQGTSSNGGQSYSGTSTFSVTVYDSYGGVACSSPPYSKQGTMWLNTAAPCWP